MLRLIAVLALPEADETKDLLSLLALADIRIRIAKDLALGILGKESKNAGLTAAALRQIMGSTKGCSPN